MGSDLGVCPTLAFRAAISAFGLHLCKIWLTSSSRMLAKFCFDSAQNPKFRLESPMSDTLPAAGRPAFAGMTIFKGGFLSGIDADLLFALAVPLKFYDAVDLGEDRVVGP